MNIFYFKQDNENYTVVSAQQPNIAQTFKHKDNILENEEEIKETNILAQIRIKTILLKSYMATDHVLAI